jgi:hypothetical protein
MIHKLAGVTISMNSHGVSEIAHVTYSPEFKVHEDFLPHLVWERWIAVVELGIRKTLENVR